MNLSLNEKYYKSLKDLKKEVESNPNFSITEFMEAYSLNRNYSRVLQDGGIIRRNTKAPSGWEWTTINPTPAMAIEVVRRFSRMAKAYYAAQLEKEQGKESTFIAENDERLKQRIVDDSDNVIVSDVETSDGVEEIIAEARTRKPRKQQKKRRSLRIAYSVTPILWGLIKLKTYYTYED